MSPAKQTIERVHVKRHQITLDNYNSYESSKKFLVLSLLFVFSLTFVTILKYTVPVLSASIEEEVIKADTSNRLFVSSPSSSIVISKIKLPRKYESKEKEGFCCPHIGCFKEITNMFKPMQPGDVKTRFTLYNRDNRRDGFKIPFSLVDHYYPYANDNDDDTECSKVLIITNSTNCPKATAGSFSELVAVKYPFNLSLLEEANFEPNLTTRIIVAGYFANEEEDWIKELIETWLDLENCNVIKVSWTGANHGLYWTAVANTRVVARQISVFLYYLDVFHPVDMTKIHLIGHSLGAHIAGFVGSDHGGNIARITGLDPAGPVFIDMDSSLRLDPTDAKFVDVIHTNAGNLMAGNLGISVNLGHVDYYPNGGSSQPGCEMTILEPIESLACNHRASYRYLIENIRRQALMVANKQDVEDEFKYLASIKVKPIAYLVQTTSPEDLVGDDNPKLSMAYTNRDLANSANSTYNNDLPIIKEIEFHQLNPNFPRNLRGLYYFKTVPDPPYYSEQYVLTVTMDKCIEKKIVFYVRFYDRIVVKQSLDMMCDRTTFLFAKPSGNFELDSDDKIEDYQGVQSDSDELRLQLYWRYRFGQINQMFDRESSPISFKHVYLENLTFNNTIKFIPGDNTNEIIIPKRVWYEMKSNTGEAGKYLIK